ncbi:hypothetical protein JL721_12564 [Aureococcus anophagefferens]|nr:hypothetical protein JL721_12564 [Aureococcus anophagefferens]
MARGMVESWADMERVWAHCYGDEGLGVASDAHPLLLTEAPLNAARHRERAAELLFESFNVPALHLAPQAILSLYASGRTTGLVLDVGDGVAHAVPVYEGFAVRHGVARSDVAGRDVTDRLQLLLARGSADDDGGARPRALSAAPSDAANAADGRARTHVLPDGSSVTLGAERFRAPEVLFDPSLVGSEDGGVHRVLNLAALRADLDLRATLYQQIVLAGGSTLFPGFGERLLKELRADLPDHTKIKIHAPPERMLSTWIGGSILASLATFKSRWVLRAEFEARRAPPSSAL